MISSVFWPVQNKSEQQVPLPFFFPHSTCSTCLWSVLFVDSSNIQSVLRGPGLALLCASYTMDYCLNLLSARQRLMSMSSAASSCRQSKQCSRHTNTHSCSLRTLSLDIKWGSSLLWNIRVEWHLFFSFSQLKFLQTWVVRRPTMCGRRTLKTSRRFLTSWRSWARKYI